MGKCLLVQSAFSAALVGWKIFEEKKNWMPDSKFFTFFMPKNDFFFRFLDPPYFRAGGRFFFGISLNFLHRKTFSGPPLFRWTCDFFDFFSLFPKEIHFPIEKKKKRRRRRRKIKWRRGAAGAEGKNIFFFFYFFFDFFFWKNNLAKFWEFLRFFFYYGFHWKSVF